MLVTLRSLAGVFNHGWRKGYAKQDLKMWAYLQLPFVIPLLLFLTCPEMLGKDLGAWLASPLFWVAQLVSLLPLLHRLHYLATRIGCVRQMNISEDGHPAPCSIDLGHRECCKHIEPGASKTSCVYWRPELIIE